MTKNSIYLMLMLFALSGCIEPYHAKTDGIDSILVVEGIITGGVTQITLTKSVGLDDHLWRYEWVNGEYADMLAVNHALVYVESDDGSIFYAARSSGNGTYLIETGELDTEKKYRLVILLDGEEYHSSFLAPAISPPVEVSFQLDHNDLINVCVSTTGNDHQPGHYLWSFTEDWEITAIMYGEWVIIDGKEVYNDLSSPNNRYYCWRKGASNILILGTTEKLIENTIRDRRIWTFTRSDERSSVLYRVTVKQHTIHKEGYDFFYNLQKNIEQTGSIFGPIPSEIMGNIRCVSNPEIPVIGYVDVSTTSTDEQYLTSIYYDSSGRSGQYRQCEMSLDTVRRPAPPRLPGSGYVHYSYEYGGFGIVVATVYIPERCVDCTKTGGSKTKPEDWPNNHQ